MDICISKLNNWGLFRGGCRKMAMIKNRSACSGVVCLLVLMVYTGFQVMYTPVRMKICPEPEDSPSFYARNESVTIVTMYLNIGSLTKTSFWLFTHKSYSTDTYRQWLLSWGKLTNKVVAFFDDDAFITQFRLLRKHLPDSHTKIIKITKENLPAFKKLEIIEKIVENPSFSVSYPATYTCVMNAKYDALEMAMKIPDMQSEYMAWMDIGLFRRLEPTTPAFTIRVPPDFNNSRVGVSQVTPRPEVERLSPQEIYQQNVVWVAGGYLLARTKVFPAFISAYRAATDSLLAQGLADTDQQVLTSMYSPQMSPRQPVQLAPYACPRGSFGLFGHGYLYFCLPYICKESGHCHSKMGSKAKLR